MTEFQASPSHVLAERIVQRLIAEQLLSSGDAAQLQARLIDGKQKAEDWRVALEKAADARTSGGSQS